LKTDLMHTGIGFDIHPLVDGKKLILGGVEIPFEKGLDGWSDADVLTHAIMDALLGAAALGDIGVHFPPGKQEFKGVSSLKLLAKVKQLLEENSWSIQNIDATVIAERPKLRDYIDSMRDKLSRTLDLHINQVSVKASTSNGIGEIGKGAGIAALATCCLAQNTEKQGKIK
jgi:2-C-methyl-D-erythritol 2,4-cyclodiphosphate synthase